MSKEPANAAPAGPVQGVVWQPNEELSQPEGEWQVLGVRELLIQWTVVDGIGFVSGVGERPARLLPDWQRISSQRWAKRIIIGLAGQFDERQARRNLVELRHQSMSIAAIDFGFKPSGWYFPVEADPTWDDAPTMLPQALEGLPRPLWISIYDQSNIGPKPFARWAAQWVPKDVGVFFQDGVGTHARSASVAREYIHELRRALGRKRVRVIAEAFRPAPGQGFRAATLKEMEPQLRAYRRYPVYLFEGPQYVNADLTRGIKRLQSR